MAVAGTKKPGPALGAVPRIMDNLVAEGKAEPMIVVMPNGNPSKQAAPGETKENLAYRPSHEQHTSRLQGGSYELSFKEIVDFVDKRYRTKAEKSKRAVAGLSMGGFHSLFISANHPDLFDYVGLFSPGINFKNVNMTIPAYNNLEEKLALQMKRGIKLYWMGIGKQICCMSRCRSIKRGSTTYISLINTLNQQEVISGVIGEATCLSLRRFCLRNRCLNQDFEDYGMGLTECHQR
jgi:hypothetical protein